MGEVARRQSRMPSSARKATLAKALPAPPDTIAVWLKVAARGRPIHLTEMLEELAGPDFTMDMCRESARLLPEKQDQYSAHWYCRFSRSPADELADLRLLDRLTRAGFHILRFDSSGGDRPAILTAD